VDLVYRRRLPVTSVARTLIDLAAVLPGSQLEAVLDHALAHRLVALAHVRNRLEALGTRGRAGAGTLATLIAARAGSRPRSTPERQLEKLLRGSGLPLALREHPVRLPGGREVRIDFAFPTAMLAVEVDSYVHHSSLGDWSRDRERNGELIALGWRILPVTPRAIAEDPGAVLERIARALRPVAAVPGGLPPRLG
jgi:very-short-patch-repair endonuclease